MPTLNLKRLVRTRIKKEKLEVYLVRFSNFHQVQILINGGIPLQIVVKFCCPVGRVPTVFFLGGWITLDATLFLTRKIYKKKFLTAEFANEKKIVGQKVP